MKRKLQALSLLVIVGLVSRPADEAVTLSLRTSGMLSRPVDLGLREGLGQMGFAASLGGLRSLVASITYLQAFTAFENIDWAKVDSLFQLTTRLQPGYATYWVEGSWHMAYNAASGYLFDDKLRPAIRRQLARDHVQRGIEILDEGLKFLPDDPQLWVTLGAIYERRGLDPLHDRWVELDPKKAGECYLRGHKNGALQVYERLGAYQLVKAGDPASLRTALEVLRRNYGMGYRTPGLIHYLKLAEEQLDIPSAQRIPDADPTPGGAR
ncbi:MAG: hypothetical protein K1X78_13620 [Verrucomicrobiaceae bacterium]|nr:hypothetical protein [Verrucomicrobiaceae bacterium]